MPLSRHDPLCILGDFSDRVRGHMYPPVLRTRLLLAVPYLFVTSLLGAAAPKERTSKQSSYARAMSEGRKAEQAADPRAAMQAFGRAVELRPPIRCARSR